MTAVRIDKLLWFLRLAKSRSLAQTIVEQGHIRLNGSRVTRCAQGVAAGDRLVLPIGQNVRAIEIVSLPLRRGPAIEAGNCYRVLDETHAYPIAAPHNEAATQEDPQP
ncbi:MAG: RNA-binding S4 domain-containing protein [Pseudomonadota bacterium]|nr:RNA-binding S4 domain-containing protein [Pseudomonadota bacterium]